LHYHISNFTILLGQMLRPLYSRSTSAAALSREGLQYPLPSLDQAGRIQKAWCDTADNESDTIDDDAITQVVVRWANCTGWLYACESYTSL
jgi:hypothetical protein